MLFSVLSSARRIRRLSAATLLDDTPTEIPFNRSQRGGTVKGAILATPDEYNGYTLTLNGKPRWTPALATPYICGETFHDAPISAKEDVIDWLGVTLAVVIGLVFFAAMTAPFPMILSIRGLVTTAVDLMRRLLNIHKGEDSDSDDSRPTVCGVKVSCGYFPEVWMAVGTFFMVFMCIFVANAVLTIAGLPCFRKYVDSVDCYEVVLPPPSPSEAALLGDEDSEDGEGMATLELQPNNDQPDNSRAVFVSPCGTSFVHIGTNTTWRVTRLLHEDCKSIPATIIYDTLEYDAVNYCMWGKKKDTKAPVGYNESNCLKGTTSESVKITKCFLRKRYTVAAIYWKSKSEEWSDCNVIQETPRLVRVVNGEEVDSPGNSQYAFISADEIGGLRERKGGFFRNPDTEEIVLKDNIQAGDLKVEYPIVFGEGDLAREYIELLAVSYHPTQEEINRAITPGVGFHKVQPPQLRTSHDDFECKQIVTLRGIDDWMEFREPCKHVTVSLADDGSGRLRFSTQSKAACNVPLMTVEGRKDTVSITATDPVTRYGITKWACDTDNNTQSLGLNCDPDKPYVEFDPKLVRAVLNVTINRTVERTGDSMSSGLEINLPGLGITSGLRDTLLTVGIIAVSLAVVAVVVFLIVKCRGNGCGGSKTTVEVKPSVTSV